MGKIANFAVMAALSLPLSACTGGEYAGGAGMMTEGRGGNVVPSLVEQIAQLAATAAKAHTLYRRIKEGDDFSETPAQGVAYGEDCGSGGDEIACAAGEILRLYGQERGETRQVGEWSCGDIRAIQAKHVNANWLVRWHVELLEREDGWFVLHAPNAEAFWRWASCEEIVAVLKGGADVHARSDDPFAWTPLHVASAFGNAAVVKTLLDAGADANAHDGYGWTVLHWAAEYSEAPAVVNALLAAGAAANALDEYGNTPLHWAAGNSKAPGVVQALLDGGAHVNARDKDGSTPLHAAARWSETLGVVRVLLAAGADVHARDNAGETPLDWGRNHRGTAGPGVMAILQAATQEWRTPPSSEAEWRTAMIVREADALRQTMLDEQHAEAKRQARMLAAAPDAELRATLTHFTARAESAARRAETLSARVERAEHGEVTQLVKDVVKEVFMVELLEIVILETARLSVGSAVAQDARTAAERTTRAAQRAAAAWERVTRAIG